MNEGVIDMQKAVKQGIPLYIMILPDLLYFLLFRYAPMGGIILAFKDFDPFEGIWASPWVGFKHFQVLFSEPDFWRLLTNTLMLSALNLFLYFPVPIVIAVLLNEARIKWFAKTVQTVVYIPHFVSWVVVVGITVVLFASQDGGVNKLLAEYGWSRIDLLTDPGYFRALYVLQSIWKETGWGTIIFLAALASIDPTLYEAAVMDGAGRWRQMWHITLPALRTIAVLLFILRLGQVMDSGFEHIYLLQNSLNLAVSDVFDTYVYRQGVLQGEYSFTTAIGLFKSIVGLIFVLAANKLAKRFGEEGVY
ncbi:ABC transporter permease [Paenibacillus konkukensis]|nr:ABC transporter permease subunit [Paenibacillus konkukensis]